MIERNFQSEFTQWMRGEGRRHFERSTAFELKLSKTKSIRFDAVAEHQRDALVSVGSGLYHKITDQPWIKDRPYSYTAKKPFDCFLITGDAFVVVMFWEPRVKKMVYFIHIGDWLRAEAQSSKKSVIEDECANIAHLAVDFFKV